MNPPITVRVAPHGGVAGYWRFEIEGYPPSGPTKTPFLTAARMLLDAGVDMNTTIDMVIDGKPSLRSNVGKAARLTVEDSPTGSTVFRPWRPFVKKEEKL